MDMMSPEVDGRSWGHALHGRASSAASLAFLAEVRGDPAAREWQRRAARDYRTLALQFPEDVFYADRSREAMYGIVRDEWYASAAADADVVLARVDELLQHCMVLAERAPRWQAPRLAVSRMHAFSAAVASSFGRWSRAESDFGAMIRWRAPRGDDAPDATLQLEAWAGFLTDVLTYAERRSGIEHGHRIASRIDEEIQRLAGAVEDDPQAARVLVEGRSGLERLRRILNAIASSGDVAADGIRTARSTPSAGPVPATP